MIEYKILHLFSGLGGGALGFQQAKEEWKGLKGSFRTLAGIDCDPEACEDFENITGAPAICMDLFSRQQYIDFHGKQPPANWREVLPADIRETTKGEYPDVIFTSPPCKGFSGLLPEKSARSKKYQALNELVIRGLFLTLEAYRDNLPGVILLENVPRITSRGAKLLHQVKTLLGQYGYLFSEGYHDCGEIGQLGQKRKRYLMIARLPDKVTAFVYEPVKHPLKTIGDVIGPMPMPDDPKAGPMHRLPRLQWKTWVRLALIPAGGDWRDLNNLTYSPRAGAYKIVPWDETSNTVTGATRGVGQSNGVSAVADPRLNMSKNSKANLYRVQRWEDAGNCVTGALAPSNGAPCIADPRVGGGYTNKRKVLSWDKPGTTVTGTADIQSGAQSIADPRLKCKPRSGSYGVMKWDEPAKTVTGAGDIHSGSAAVSDPRIPKETENGIWIIMSEDGSWHRPLTTLELAALQGFPLTFADGSPLVLAGSSDARWRERIGNAVPPPAAKAIGETILRALLPSEYKAWVMSAYLTPVWVRPSKEEVNYIGKH